LAPEKGIESALAETVDGLRHLALERLPAHLAVRDYLKACRLLQTYHLIDGPILFFLEICLTDSIVGEILLRFE
tara:strand:- start:566 stop:787 length:222 start_codon:yes stop_codon:yes gene_type:complete